MKKQLISKDFKRFLINIIISLIIALPIYFVFFSITSILWYIIGVEPPEYWESSPTVFISLAILAKILVFIIFFVSLWLGYKITSKFINPKK